MHESDRVLGALVPVELESLYERTGTVPHSGDRDSDLLHLHLLLRLMTNSNLAIRKIAQPVPPDVECACPNDVQLIIHSGSNSSVGVLFEGDRGRFFVNRGRVTGKPAEELVDNPLPEDAIVKAYGGRNPGNHMRNFFECVRERALPISDVF